MKRFILTILTMFVTIATFSQILIDEKRDGKRVVSTKSAVLTPQGKSPLVYIGYSVKIEGKQKAYYLTVGIKSTQPITQVNAGDKLLLKVGEKDVLKYTAMANGQFSQQGKVYYSNSTYRVDRSELERIARASRMRIGMSGGRSLDVDVEATGHRDASRQLAALYERVQ